MKLEEIENIKLINLYGDLLKELKRRQIIRTKNVVGEIGEYLAINHYSQTRGLPKLVEAPISTNNIDAISDRGERYTIKTITGNTTGVFYGLPALNDDAVIRQMFEYVVIVILDEFYDLKMIVELTWEQFLKYKKWHSRMSAWNITINRDLINNANIIYNRETE